jgi:hypothetical protein
MHHTSFAAPHAANGALAGGPRRRRRRSSVRPSRSNRAPIVLAAGQPTCGGGRSSQARTFTGPQVGCARRTARQRSTIAAATACGWRSGARARSSNPATPASRYRSSHLYPIRRLIPNRRHSAAIASSPAATASTKRIRSSITQVSRQTIGKALPADQVSCYPCPRSTLLPI